MEILAFPASIDDIRIGADGIIFHYMKDGNVTQNM